MKKRGGYLTEGEVAELCARKSKRKRHIGDEVRFSSVDDNGFEFEAEGGIVGFGARIRDISPIEMGECPDDAILVAVKTSDKTKLRLEVIDESQIIKEVKQ